MKRKLLLVFASIFMVVSCAIGLAACDFGADTHKHSYSTEWAHDETYHWHAATCEHKDEVSNKALHTLDSGVVTIEPTCTTKGKITYTCTVCRATKTEEIPANGHNFSDEWTNDETYHWHKCNNCDEISGKAEHTWANGVCSVCLMRKVSSGLKYELSSNGKYYSVVGIGTCTDKDIVIPSKYNDLPVTAIGYEAFSDSTALESIEIPVSVTSIEKSAFSGCSSLTSIEIPDGVTCIERATFSECSSLTSISIPDSVTSIENLAFYRCSSLTNIKIPDGVTSIGATVFSGCTTLTNIEIPNGVTSIESSTFYNCSSLTNIEIPDSVMTIEGSAFYYCSGLESVTIPRGVTTIEDHVFAECVALESIEILGRVTGIGDYAFAGCSLLASIKIPDSVTSIGEGAFYSCLSLTNIKIPDKVTSMGIGVFYNCSALTIYCEAKSVPSGWNNSWNKNFPDGSVVWDCNNNDIANDGYIYSVIDGLRYRLKDGVASVVQQPRNISGNKVILKSIIYKDISYIVTAIENSAFDSCNLLEGIEIPDSVTSIGEAAFAGCSLLVSITIPDGVTSIEDLVFKNCSSLTSIEIPDSVMSIGSHSFVGCSSLTHITIPDSVTSIGAYTFDDCSSLTSIVIPNSITSIGFYAFKNCLSLATVYYGGTEEEWNNINIDSSNSVFTEVDIYYYSETPPTDSSNYWHYDMDGKTLLTWSKETFNSTF